MLEQKLKAAWSAFIAANDPSADVSERAWEDLHFTERNAWFSAFRAFVVPTDDPQPVQHQCPMAETIEEAASDVAKSLNESDGQGLDLRHVAMLVNHAQKSVQQEPVAKAAADKAVLDRMAKYVSTITQSEIDEADSDRGITSPQAAQPLSDEESRSAFEAFVSSELGDVAVMDQGRYISPKIQNYWRTWQAAHGITGPTS